MDEKTDMNPGQSEPPPMPSQPPAPPKPNRKKAVIGLTAGAVALIGITAGVTSALVSGSGSSAPDPKPKATRSARPAATQAPKDTYNEAPVATDFIVGLKTTSKHCFGSAGCNIEAEPNPNAFLYIGSDPLDPDKSYDITYEIRGGTDGPVIETMTLSDTDQLSFQPSMVSTSTEDKKLTLHITDVEVSG